MAPHFSKYLTRNNLCAAAGLGATVGFLLLKKAHNSHYLKSNTFYAESKVEALGNAFQTVKSITSYRITNSYLSSFCSTNVPVIENEEEIKYVITEKKKKSSRVKVSKQSVHDFLKLLKILIPGWNTPEFGFLILVTISLASRSLCDIWLNNYVRRLEGFVITRDSSIFKEKALKYICLMPLISLVNNVLKYSIGELQIHLRSNMTQHLYNLYLTKNTYYWVSNLDNRVANIDQILTTDLEKFCLSITDFYCNLAKPLLDITIYSSILWKNLSYKTPAILFCFVVFGGALITEIRKPVAGFTAVEQKLEGEFRYVNTRVITHSEEIAFYQGSQREKTILFVSFSKLMNHLRKFLYFRIFMGIVDDLVVKHFAYCVGFWAFSIPFFSEGHKLRSTRHEERSVLYYTYGAMLVLLGQAGARLVVAGHDVMRLAGFTLRITELQNVIADLNEGKYKRSMLSGSEHLQPNTGRFIYIDNLIKFDKVPITTPNGDVLIKELSFEIHSSMNVLINGPNGCGKSSLFRILGELWPLFGGEITKPLRSNLFYIPQKSYMTLGSLRDQIIYPHSKLEAATSGRTDDILKQHLKRVHLEYLIEREGGFDAIADWLDVLSGGEKQRIAMARLFYHAPQFAILDECTSAVSADVEGDIYMYCRKVGITLLTVSHRKSLWKYHDYVLSLDGNGGYSFKKIEDCS